MEITNFKEAYETLLREYATIRQQLDQWQTGGILWTWEDVHLYASDELSIRLTTDEAKAILAEVIENHNPDRGVTWMVIDKAIKKAKDLLPISLSDYTPAPATLRLVAPDRTSEITYTSKTDILRYLRTHGFFGSNNSAAQRDQLLELVSGYRWHTAHGQHSIVFNK